MSADTYIAVDLGAGSGRVIAAELSRDGRLGLREVSRFPNVMIRSQGALRWDAAALLDRVRCGISAALERAPAARSAGVDAWGVDFGLIDGHGRLIADPIAYRDPGFAGSMSSFLEKIPATRVFSITGIQFLEFNTLFRLHAMSSARDPELAAATRLLFMPDLVANLLCGSALTERTVASTSQMLDASTGKWSHELARACGVDLGLLGDLSPHGAQLGRIGRCPSGLPVVSVAAHDTASAVAAVPADEGSEFAYISCGTWSLMGFEADAPSTGKSAFDLNFTSEEGACGTYRVLRNITGMWLLQECLRAWGADAPSLDALMEHAAAAAPFERLIDPDDPRFASPTDMPAAIAESLEAAGQPEPRTRGEFARTVMDSLALAHARTLGMVASLRGRGVEVVHMIGGGSRNELLCQLTANACGLPVLAGPAEATAAGNALVQAMADGRLGSLREIRAVSRRSFAPKAFEPRLDDRTEAARSRFEAICARRENQNREARGQESSPKG